MTKTTEQLKVGDTIEVWWKPGRDTITKLEPYAGPLKECKGARMATFALNPTGMTCIAKDVFEIVTSMRNTDP
jgi:hypothetical protein